MPPYHAQLERLHDHLIDQLGVPGSRDSAGDGKRNALPPASACETDGSVRAPANASVGAHKSVVRSFVDADESTSDAPTTLAAALSRELMAAQRENAWLRLEVGHARRGERVRAAVGSAPAPGPAAVLDDDLMREVHAIHALVDARTAPGCASGAMVGERAHAAGARMPRADGADGQGGAALIGTRVVTDIDKGDSGAELEKMVIEIENNARALETAHATARRSVAARVASETRAAALDERVRELTTALEMRDRDRDDYDELSLEVQVLRDAFASQAKRIDDERSGFRRQISQLETQLERAKEELQAAHRKDASAFVEKLVAEDHAILRKPTAPTNEGSSPHTRSDETTGDDADGADDGTTKRVAELETQVCLRAHALASAFGTLVVARWD